MDAAKAGADAGAESRKRLRSKSVSEAPSLSCSGKSPDQGGPPQAKRALNVNDADRRDGGGAVQEDRSSAPDDEAPGDLPTFAAPSHSLRPSRSARPAPVSVGRVQAASAALAKLGSGWDTESLAAPGGDEGQLGPAASGASGGDAGGFGWGGEGEDDAQDAVGEGSPPRLSAQASATDAALQSSLGSGPSKSSAADVSNAAAKDSAKAPGRATASQPFDEAAEIKRLQAEVAAADDEVMLVE